MFSSSTHCTIASSPLLLLRSPYAGAGTTSFWLRWNQRSMRRLRKLLRLLKSRLTPGDAMRLAVAVAAGVLLLSHADNASGSQALLHAAANRASGGGGGGNRAPGGGGGGAPAAGAAHARPDWRVYHQTDALLAEMRATVGGCRHARAWVVDVDRGGGGGGGEQDGALVIGVGEGMGSRRREGGWMVGATGAGASGNEGGNGRKVRVLAAFGEHGRELVSSEVALAFVRRVCGTVSGVAEGEGDGDTGSSSSGGREEHKVDAALMRELRRTEFVLVPVVGAASRRLVEGGRYCERGNARGIDVNRNFAFEWGRIDEETMKEEERPGVSAFSEAEARVLHVLGMHFRPHVYISLHSGERALIVPWDSGNGKSAVDAEYEILGDASKAKLRPPVGPDVLEVAEAVRKAHCADCKVGTAGELLGYNAYGTGVDFMYAVVHAPIAMTWEVYGDDSAHEDDCVRMFNPIGRDAYNKVVDNWARAFETLSASVHALGDGVVSGSDAGLGRALFGKAWARVAERLGSDSWADAAYNAAIRVDGEAHTVHGRRRLEREAAHWGLRAVKGGGYGRESLAAGVALLEAEAVLHPAAAIFGALMTIMIFSCMVFLLRHFVLVRRRRTPRFVSSFSNGAPAARRGRQHVRGNSLNSQGNLGIYEEKAV